MFQVRIHGRGGQGVVSAAEMLSVADVRDLEAKVTHAMSIRGARYIHIPVPCPLGWGSQPQDTVKLTRLATESGLFPVFEAEHGEITDRRLIRRKVPVECFECDTCYGVCPDNTVIKLGPGKRFAFNYDYCKGCGLCVAECPCGAIRMEREPD